MKTVEVPTKSHQDAQLAQHVTKVHSAFEKKVWETAKTTGGMVKKNLGGGFKDSLLSSLLGEMICNLTSIFFNRVGSTTK